MKAKMKKEAGQTLQASGLVSEGPPQRLADIETPGAPSSSSIQVSTVAGDPEISEVEVEGDADAQMQVYEEGSDGTS